MARVNWQPIGSSRHTGTVSKDGRFLLFSRTHGYSLFDRTSGDVVRLATLQAALAVADRRAGIRKVEVHRRKG